MPQPFRTRSAIAQTSVIVVSNVQDAESITISVPTNFTSKPLYQNCVLANHADSSTLYGNLMIASCFFNSNDPRDAYDLWEYLYALHQDNLGQAFRWSDQNLIIIRGFIAKAVSAIGGTPSPAPAPVNTLAASLSGDPIFTVCRNQHIVSTGNQNDTTTTDIYSEFSCVYARQDYRAAEVLGQTLILRNQGRGSSALKDYRNGRIPYMVANTFYTRGNSRLALQYAKLGYSLLSPTARTLRCSKTECQPLRALLVRLDPSYRGRFAAQDRQAQADAAEAAREAAAIALNISGSGIHQTEYFHVNAEWELDWSYDCSNFSDGTGNFIVDIDGDVSQGAVNELGGGTSGTEYLHQGGNIYLSINSECDWTVEAVNE